MPEREIARDEAEAALSARHELGRDYEPAIVESFVNRLETAIDQRVTEEVARRVSSADGQASAYAKAAAQRSGHSLALAIVSLGISIPLTAIVAFSPVGFAGVMFIWVAIVMVNLVFALGGRSLRPR